MASVAAADGRELSGPFRFAPTTPGHHHHPPPTIEAAAPTPPLHPSVVKATADDETATPAAARALPFRRILLYSGRAPDRLPSPPSQPLTERNHPRMPFPPPTAPFRRHNPRCRRSGRIQIRAGDRDAVCAWEYINIIVRIIRTSTVLGTPRVEA